MTAWDSLRIVPRYDVSLFWYELVLMMAKIHYGTSIEPNIPLIPLHQFALQQMKNNGDKIYLTNATTNISYTFSEMVASSSHIAAGLQGLGTNKGDVICLYGYNSAEYVNMIIGSLAAGMVINSNNPAATPYELRHYFKHVQPRLIFTEDELLPNVQAALDAVNVKPMIITRQHNQSYLSIDELSAKGRNVTNIIQHTYDVKNDVAFILFSSGTTGLPKGVMLTHYNMVAHCVLRTMLKFNPPEYSTNLCIFPMYHAAGLLGGILAGTEGRQIVFMEKYKLETLLEAIQHYKFPVNDKKYKKAYCWLFPVCPDEKEAEVVWEEPVILQTPPSVIVQLAKTPLLIKYNVSSIQLVMTGAAPLKHETEEIFKKRFNYPAIGNGYGLTETSSGVIWKTGSVADQSKPGTSGKPTLSTALKIVDPETGKLLGPHQSGEIYIHSPLVMKGYLNNPEATRACINKDGWFQTGDVGYYDDDGFFYIVDRLKELIKYKGNQVAPAELEALLLEHGDVIDVGVVGIPDAEAGELPRAYIVMRENSGLTEQKVIDYVNENVSHYKRLRGGVIFLDEIPKLSSGKILRRKLREIQPKISKL